jgi:hypothetical protein
MRIRLYLILLLLAAVPLRAENSLPVPQTPEQAAAQRQKAEDLRKEAQRRYEEEEAACYRKTLVGACLDAAKERRTRMRIEARRLDAPAREFERESRRAGVEEGKRRQAEDLLTREAKQEEEAERYRDEQAAKASEREQKRQEKERRMEKKREKLAEEQAKRQRAEEKRAKKQAEKIEKQAKKRAKAEKKAAKKGE